MVAPVERLVLNIEPHQTGSGTPSPSNIRPISGYDAVNVVRCGHNLLENTASSLTQNGLTFTVNSDGSVLVTGTASATTLFNINADLSLDSNKSYTLSGCPSGGSSSTYMLRVYNTSGTQVCTDVGNGYTFQSSVAKYVRITIVSGYACPSGGLLYHPMLRLATDTDSTYEPFKGLTTYPISLSAAGTVYGGTLNVTTGELVVDTAYRSLSAVAMNGTALSGSVRRFYSSPLIEQIGVVACDSLIASDSYVYSQVGYISFSTDNRLVVTPSWAQSLTTVADYNTALASNPVNLVFKLATPITYQLTPTEVTTLLGDNNIWMDADGELEMTYTGYIN